MNCKKWNKIDMFIDMEEDPLKKYNYFKKIEFNKCNIFSLYLNHYLNYSVLFIHKNLKIL